MNENIDTNDKRWGGYIPWFLRHKDFTGSGNFLLFFERLSNRVFQLFQYNEVGIPNLMHFGSLLESKSLQRFRYVFKNEYGAQSTAFCIRDYFSATTIRAEAGPFLNKDPLEIRLQQLKMEMVISEKFRGGVDPNKHKGMQEARQKISRCSRNPGRKDLIYIIARSL